MPYQHFLINKHDPLKRVIISVKHIKREFGLIKGLLKSLHQKKVLFKKCHEIPKQDPQHTKYMNYCKILNKLKTLAKRNYYTSPSEHHQHDVKKHGP